jgi:hypothetical protein
MILFSNKCNFIIICFRIKKQKFHVVNFLLLWFHIWFPLLMNKK